MREKIVKKNDALPLQFMSEEFALGILFGRVIDAAKSGEQVAIENTDVNNKNNYIAQGCHPRKPAQA